MSDTSVARAFRSMALSRPGAPALVFTDDTYSYAMLSDLAAAFAIRMADAGIGPDSTIQIQSDDLAISLAGTLAAAIRGARLCERAITPKLDSGYPITHVLAEAPCPGPWTEVIVDASFSPADLSREAKDAAWDSAPSTPIDPWLILSTSGTTGMPKALGLSEPLVLARAAAVREDLGGESARVALLFTPGSRPFLARALPVLLQGGTLVEKTGWDLWDKAGVTLVSGSVAQARRLMASGRAAHRLPRVEIIGARPGATDIRDLLTAFEVVDDTFGASEVHKAHSTYHREGEGAPTGRSWATAIEIVDDTGTPVPPGDEGRLRIASDLAIGAYLGAAADLPILQDGWFLTGDIARMTDTGALEILYRDGAEVVSLGGTKINLQLVDAVLRSTGGIADAAAFPTPKPDAEGLLAFAVFNPGTNVLQAAERARLACRTRLGTALVPTRVWPTNVIPRLDSGLVDREACRRMILDAAAADQAD